VHPVEESVEELEELGDYPPDVMPVPELLPETAAFAAQSGLRSAAGRTRYPYSPRAGLRVVGHNLDSVKNYEARRSTGFSHRDVHHRSGLAFLPRRHQPLMRARGLQTLRSNTSRPSSRSPTTV
jgi:hypothetical protein